MKQFLTNKKQTMRLFLLALFFITTNSKLRAEGTIDLITTSQSGNNLTAGATCNWAHLLYTTSGFGSSYIYVYASAGEVINLGSSGFGLGVSDMILTAPDGTIFVQTHRSYIVNVSKVSQIGKNFIIVNDTEIPLSQSRKEEFLKYFNFL